MTKVKFYITCISVIQQIIIELSVMGSRFVTMKVREDPIFLELCSGNSAITFWNLTARPDTWNITAMHDSVVLIYIIYQI